MHQKHGSSAPEYRHHLLYPSRTWPLVDWEGRAPWSERARLRPRGIRRGNGGARIEAACIRGGGSRRHKDSMCIYIYKNGLVFIIKCTRRSDELLNWMIQLHDSRIRFHCTTWDRHGTYVLKAGIVQILK